MLFRSVRFEVIKLVQTGDQSFGCDNNLGSIYLLPGLLGVPTIRHENRVFLPDKKKSVRSRKSARPSDIGEGRK